VKAEFEAVIAAGKTSKTLVARQGIIQKIISGRRNAVGALINKTPEKAVKQALNSDNPIKNTASLVGAVKRSRAAKSGLRDTFINMSLKAAETVDKTQAGKKLLSGRRLGAFLDKHGSDAVGGGLITPRHLKRLRKIQKQAEIAESSGIPTAKAAAGKIGKEPAGVLSLNQLLSRAYGIQRGVVGAPFVIGEVGSRLVNRFIRGISTGEAQRLLRQSIYDHDLARTLLMKGESIPQQKIIIKRLRGHLLSIVSGEDEN